MFYSFLLSSSLTDSLNYADQLEPMIGTMVSISMGVVVLSILLPLIRAIFRGVEWSDDSNDECDDEDEEDDEDVDEYEEDDETTNVDFKPHTTAHISDTRLDKPDKEYQNKIKSDISKYYTDEEKEIMKLAQQ